MTITTNWFLEHEWLLVLEKAKALVFSALGDVKSAAEAEAEYQRRLVALVRMDAFSEVRGRALRM